jgi:hypothetical protein
MVVAGSESYANFASVGERVLSAAHEQVSAQRWAARPAMT